MSEDTRFAIRSLEYALRRRRRTLGHTPREGATEGTRHWRSARACDARNAMKRQTDEGATVRRRQTRRRSGRSPGGRTGRGRNGLTAARGALLEIYYRARKDGLHNIFKKNPGRAEQNSQGTAGTNFTNQRTSHYFVLSTNVFE